MGCVVSCMQQATMSLFGRHSRSDNSSRSKLDRKLYIAKESPEPEFDLSECQLRYVPSGIFSICKVYRKEYLYLQVNNLQTLNEGGQLSDLYLIKILNISCNRFVNLPSDIKYLVNLTELYLQENQISTLPDHIQFLQSLQILDVSQNKLRTLNSALGKLNNLRKLNVKGNTDLTELCPELCLASNITLLELDGHQYTFPPPDIATKDTIEIMKYLCENSNIEYTPPLPVDSNISLIQTPNSIQDPFAKSNPISWEEQEAAIIEQENKYHEAAKQQREKFLTKILQEQLQLDSEIAKVHECREQERQRLIKAIQADEKEIECLVTNFIQSEYLRPEVIQQQLAHEQAEHDRLLEITRQNYDNIRKADVLKAMEALIEEDCSIQHSKKHYEDSLYNMKQNLLLKEVEGADKLAELLKAKDESRSVLVEQLLEDQDIQKALVASLIERVDARSWSLNQEISLISSHLARLSIIEQEKRKLQITYNYNELLHQRVQLVNLLDDLLEQQIKRRKQLVDTLREMESETDKSTDFWLKNYQKLIDSAPRTLLDVGKHLDPVLANYLLQEGVIHCLPFLVKFIFSGDTLLNITLEQLKENGVSLSSDREGIIKAITLYVQAKTKNADQTVDADVVPTAPLEEVTEEQNCTGVVETNEMESSEMGSECVICMDERCEVVFIPCGHMCCCLSCTNKNLECCPMCRGAIDRTIKIILA